MRLKTAKSPHECVCICVNDSLHSAMPAVTWPCNSYNCASMRVCAICNESAILIWPLLPVPGHIQNISSHIYALFPRILLQSIRPLFFCPLWFHFFILLHFAFFFCSVSHFPQTHDSDRMPYYSVLPVMCAQHMRDAMQAGALTYHSNAYLACCSSLADTRQSRLERTNERPTEFNCIVLARCRRFEWLALCVCSLCIVHVHMWSIVVPSDMSGVVKSVPILYGMLRCCVVDGVYAKCLDASRRCALAFVLMQPSVNLFTRTYKSITKMAMNCAEQRIPRVQVQGWLMNHESWIHEVLSWLTS